MKFMLVYAKTFDGDVINFFETKEKLLEEYNYRKDSGYFGEHSAYEIKEDIKLDREVPYP